MCVTTTLLTYPEATVSARVREVDDQFERLVMVRLQREQHVVDQHVAIRFTRTETETGSDCIERLNEAPVTIACFTICT